jgi:HEAT repeat protein
MSIYQLERDGDVEELRVLLEESDSSAVRERAARALGEIVTEEEGAADVLVRAAVQDDDARVRAAAIDGLDDIGGDALRRLFVELNDVPIEEGADLPVEVLVNGLEDDAAELRMVAATAISHDAVAEATPALVDRLADPDPRVRLRVVRALGNVGDARDVDPIASLADGGSARLRKEVATALGEIGGEAALAALDPLLDDPELGVRRNAVAALSQFPRCRPIEPLVERLEDDAAEIRRTAIYSIVDLLSDAPAGQSHELRTEVVQALSASRDGDVLDTLVELFDESTEARRRRNAAWLIGRVSDGDEVAIQTLVVALGDDDEAVRQFAATSLAIMGGPAVEDALLDALETMFGAGREMILYVLGKVGSERARRRLLSLLDEVEDLETQERTLAALSKLGGT